MIRFVYKSILFTLATFAIYSCVEYDGQDKDELVEIEEYTKNGNYSKIGDYDIYLEFYNRSGIDQIEGHVEYGDAVLINYDWEYLSGELISTTDSIKGTEAFPDSYKVYGPTYLQTYNGYIEFALDTALMLFSESDTGSLVYPSRFGDYSGYPKAINLGLVQIIEDDSTYASDLLNDFITTNSFTSEFYNGIYYKYPNDASQEISDTAIRKVGDFVSVNITGRYAETYYAGGLGRVFYPLLSQSAADTFEIGETSEDFPYIEAIDSALAKMNIGDIMEIAVPYDEGWGIYGYTYSYNNTSSVLVQPYMPLHYTIELVAEIE